MKYVMMYETAPEGMARAREHYVQHRARLDEFHARGVRLMSGPFLNLDGTPSGGAIGIFTTREAAEEFVRGDPFVLNGVVASWKVQDWNEVLAP